MMTGQPREVVVSSTDTLEAYEEVIESIIEMVHDVLELTPPELVADISQNGIVLTGGNSMLWGFDRLISSRTSISTMTADDADLCVANGLGRALSWVGDMSEGPLHLARRKQMKM